MPDLSYYRQNKPHVYALAMSDEITVKYLKRIARLEAGLIASNEGALRAAARVKLHQVEVEVLQRTIASMEREFEHRIRKLKQRLKSKQRVEHSNKAERDQSSSSRKAAIEASIKEARTMMEATALALCEKLNQRSSVSNMAVDLTFEAP